MGRVITVASAKGGVGKTTTVLNLGFELGRFAGRVLLVDADPQAGLASASNLRATNPEGLLDLVLGRSDAERVVTSTRDPGLSLVGFGAPEDADLAAYDRCATSGAISSALRELATGFDYVIADAPAGVGSITRALLEGSDGLLIPVQARSLAVKTLPGMLRLLRSVRAGKNPALELAGVVITMLDYVSNAEYEISRSIRDVLPEGALLRTAIPRNEQFERASMEALPVALLSDAQRASKAYLELAMELKSREMSSQLAGKEGDGELGLF